MAMAFGYTHKPPRPEQEMFLRSTTHNRNGNLLHSYWKWLSAKWVNQLFRVGHVKNSYVNVYQRVTSPAILLGVFFFCSRLIQVPVVQPPFWWLFHSICWFNIPSSRVKKTGNFSHQSPQSSFCRPLFGVIRFLRTRHVSTSSRSPIRRNQSTTKQLQGFNYLISCLSKPMQRILKITMEYWSWI